MTQTLMRRLLNTGISAHDAAILDEHFANERGFLEGLEDIARLLAFGPPAGILPPAGEPWRTLWERMKDATAAELEEAYTEALKEFPAAVQVAISGAVAVRQMELQNFQAQLGNKKQRKTGDYIRALANLGYSFRMNMCDDSVEVNGERLTDPLRAEIRMRLRDAGVREVNIAEDAYLAEAWKHRYHPVRDFLLGLQWDGTDYIEQMAGYVEDEQGVFVTWLRRWMVGAVARAMLNGTQNRMLVLDGSQGIGKSYFARWIASPLPAYFYEGPISPDSKDDRVRLMRVWIWEVTELGATTRRADREALKGFLSLREVTVRRPYGRFDITKPAMASFIGTVNNEAGFLNDPTGNRRFMVATLKAIDWGYTKALTPEALWAQAAALYMDGEPWELTPEEAAQANEINEYYTIEDPVQAALLKHFDIDPQRRDWWLATVDIVQVLEAEGYKWGSLRAASMAVSGAAAALGLRKAKRRSGSQRLIWGWAGIRRKSNLP